MQRASLQMRLPLDRKTDDEIADMSGAKWSSKQAHQPPKTTRIEYRIG